METFLSETENGKDYLIEEIIEDGACFYRAFGNSLLFNSRIESLRTLFLTPSDQLLNLKWDISRKNNIEHYFRKRLQGAGYREQTIMAKFIQKIAKDWIVNNYNEKMESGETIGECLKMTHSILDQPELEDITEVIKYYDTWYNYFSGDEVTYKDDNGEECSLAERWASTIEQYALSRIFQIPIQIYTDQRYDEDLEKITKGIVNLAKGQSVGSTRLRLLSIIGQEFIDPQKPIIKLLYRFDNEKGLHHYMVLYPKL